MSDNTRHDGTGAELKWRGGTGRPPADSPSEPDETKAEGHSLRIGKSTERQGNDQAPGGTRWPATGDDEDVDGHMPRR